MGVCVIFRADIRMSVGSSLDIRVCREESSRIGVGASAGFSVSVVLAHIVGVAAR